MFPRQIFAKQYRILLRQKILASSSSSGIDEPKVSLMDDSVMLRSKGMVVILGELFGSVAQGNYSPGDC